MSGADVLREARDLISTPKRWTQGAFWRGWGTDRCYCIDGAVYKVRCDRKSQDDTASLALSLAARSRGYETASQLNDAPGTSYADVLGLLDEAAAIAESLNAVPS